MMDRQEAIDPMPTPTVAPKSTEAHAPTPAPRLNRPDRSQVDPDPGILDELLAQDHPARLVWALVLELDMTALHAKIASVEGHAGRSAIDPRILTALWLYATKEGIVSARRLEDLCYRDDVYKWLRGGVDVNYHTLADFRTDHADWLEQQVVTGIATLRAEGLVDLNQVGQDGLRVRASAGTGSFRKEEKLRAHLEEAQQQWDRLEQELAADPNQNQRQLAARKRAARERLERLKRAIEQLPELQAARESRKKGDGSTARVSPTDPDARRMKMPDGGFRPAYNVELATTLDTLVVVGVDVINVGSDGGQMDPMVERIEQQQQCVPNEHYTDGGFSTMDDIEKVSRRGVTLFTPVKETKRQQDEGKDPYAPRPGDSPEVGQWRQRMGTDEAKTKYRNRSKCEWTNAMCRNRNLQQFKVRGLQKVRTVVLWFVLIHNMLRTVALRAQRALPAAA